MAVVLSRPLVGSSKNIKEGFMSNCIGVVIGVVVK
jgi:hypothetical protein